MRLARPYITLATRVEVARRQLIASGMLHVAVSMDSATISDAQRLKTMLYHLFGEERAQLDHDPALCNRKKRYRKSGKFRCYEPQANDPKFLVYRTTEHHDIKTRVRGDGAQLSDLAMLRKNKRIAKRIKDGKRPKYGGWR